MAARRHAARLVTVCAVVGALVALGASPVLAEEDSVRVSAAGRFTAGGSAQGVAVEVRKRTNGCVLLRTALALRLDGLRADQVQVQVNAAGRWFPVPVSGGGGGVSTAATSPANPRLCKGKSITVRYRVAFAAGAPDGRLEVVGEATSVLGRVLGRGSDTSRVVGGRASASPTPTPTPTRSRTPSPTPTPTPSLTPSATVPVAAPAGDGTSVDALAGPVGGAASPVAAEDSGGSPIMFFGLAMVAVGIVLIVLLIRRSREDKEETSDASPTPGGSGYRSAQGPGVVPGRPGAVYGQPGSGPATPGIYGAPPAQRPSAGLYGAPADATQVMPQAPAPADRHGAPPAPAPPVPHQYGTPVSGPPAAPPAPPAEDDRTRFMPRLPD